jgi:hypothetical protein
MLEVIESGERKRKVRHLTAPDGEIYLIRLSWAS